MIKNKQKGDTIIEVLIAMAVIGLTIAAAFGIANRGLTTSRNAQEREEALKIAETQIELFKVYAKTASNADINSFTSKQCVYINGAIISKKAEGEPECESGFYKYSIEKSADTFIFSVVWERLGGSGTNSQDELELYYRL